MRNLFARAAPALQAAGAALAAPEHGKAQECGQHDKASDGASGSYRTCGILLAQRLSQAAPVPAGWIGIAIAVDGSSSRYHSGQNIAPPWQKAFLLHSGPHRCQLCLHPATPEIALDLRFVLDSPDPRVPQQRFDLFLSSEIDDDLTLAAMAARLQAGLQAEFASGGLDCFAQMSLPEWMRFRAQLERWLYTRFGLTVEDCALVDVGDQVDYAQILLARAAAQAASHPASPVPGAGTPASSASLSNHANSMQVGRETQASPAAMPQTGNRPAVDVSDAGTLASRAEAAGADAGQNPARAAAAPPTARSLPSWISLPWFDSAADAVAADAAGLRRLFIELPDFAMRWRALNPSPGFFALQQSSLQRLSLLRPLVAGMPALTLAAPNQSLAHWQIAARSDAMRQALAAWEQAWSLLARLDDLPGTGTQSAAALLARWQAEQDAILRITGNLEHCLALRAQVPEQPA